MKSRSATPIRIAKGSYIGVSILLCIAGITMMCLPNLSVNVIGTLFGILMIGLGTVKLLGFFSRDLFRLAFQYDLQFGILLILFGAVMLFKTENVMNFLTVALGMLITADCLFKLKTSIEAKHFGIKNWWLTFALAIINGVLGITIMFWPQGAVTTITIILGVMLLADGILNLCVAISMIKIVKHQKVDVINAEYREI
ncbi:MAG: DUF308 domain-containing protein [Lachnospiraceae bacterium]|nr:DUF308 domain-containing protein [Lachnospiraceae bacterium]